MQQDIDALKTEIDIFIKRALMEDVREGDHSSMACIPADAKGKAKLLVKEDGILAGMQLAQYIFNKVDPKMQFSGFLQDGQEVKKGDIAFTIEGSVRNILMLERLVLNCMQRMSGIATKTRQMTSILAGLNTKLLDTRKTTPCIRFLEKWAVRIGGGQNHRIGLYDMIMLKDNHIDAAGGIKKAILDVKKYQEERGLKLKVEVETRNLDEVKQVLDTGYVDRIMLDNFTPELLKEAITLIGGRYETEASGGITEQNMREYANTGVDFISTSAITHSVKSIDLSLKITS
jgi:nicotinate-nucleotide pyrophosphorylase (carboxylating)